MKRQYDLQTLQSDLMTAQKISRDGTAGSIGSDITESVRMILNVLEGERAFERSLIKAEQASTSGPDSIPECKSRSKNHSYNDIPESRKSASNLISFYSDSSESSEASGNESNVSDDDNDEEKDGSNVLKDGDGSNVSSSSEEEDLASRQNRPRGSSASDHYWTDTEDFLKSGTPGVNPAPEVTDPTKTGDADADKMDADDAIETHPSTQDLDLDAKM